VVKPLNQPEIISGISSSARGVVPFAPDFLREISAVKSSIFKGKPALTPSIVTPIAGPCDSPKIDILNICPKEFIGSLFVVRG